MSRRASLSFDRQCELVKRIPPKPNRACEVCGGAFYASPGHVEKGWGRYCGMKCRARAWTGSGNARYNHDVADRKCENCGSGFRVKPCAVKKGEGRFCSRDCKRQQLNGSRICEQCGRQMVLPISHLKRRRFCSSECLSASALNRVWNCVCESCGKWFYRKPSDLNRVDLKGNGRFCSMSCKARGMVQRHQPKYKHSKSGKRADLNDRYFRSAWEANYARYLNWMQSLGEIRCWDYEPDTFEFPVKRGSRFYTPDFKVTWANDRIEYHEVKGYMDAKSATKLKRMAKHYPSLKLVLIDSLFYAALVKRVSPMISGWE